MVMLPNRNRKLARGGIGLHDMHNPGAIIPQRWEEIRLRNVRFARHMVQFLATVRATQLTPLD